jgi:hypothetical protein
MTRHILFTEDHEALLLALAEEVGVLLENAGRNLSAEGMHDLAETVRAISDEQPAEPVKSCETCFFATYDGTCRPCSACQGWLNGEYRSWKPKTSADPAVTLSSGPPLTKPWPPEKVEELDAVLNRVLDRPSVDPEEEKPCPHCGGYCGIHTEDCEDKARLNKAAREWLEWRTDHGGFRQWDGVSIDAIARHLLTLLPGEAP